MKQSIEAGMAVRQFGNGDKHIVYLHGLGEAGGIFEALLADPLLANAVYTHVVPDLPGYGRSPWPDTPAGLKGLAAELASWLKNFAQPPLLVGHSMGGVLAVLIAEGSPSLVKAVVNIEGNVSLGDCRFSGRVAAWDGEDYGVNGHTAIAETTFELARDGQPERYYYAAFRFADPKSTHRHARDLVEISATESMAQRMAALTVPAVFIAGVPDGLAERSLELLSQSGTRTVRVQPAGHWAYVDQPTECARVVAELA